MIPVRSSSPGAGDVESVQDVAGNNQASSDTSPGSDASPEQQQQQQLAQWLWKMATFILGMAVGKFHLNQQAHGVLFIHGFAYYLVLNFIYLVGVVEVGTALLVSQPHANGRLLAFGRFLLWVSLVALALLIFLLQG